MYMYMYMYSRHWKYRLVHIRETCTVDAVRTVYLEPAWSFLQRKQCTVHTHIRSQGYNNMRGP